MCQCRLTNCKKCTTQCRMLRVGDAMHVEGRKVYGKFLYLLVNFVVDLKLL